MNKALTDINSSVPSLARKQVPPGPHIVSGCRAGALILYFKKKKTMNRVVHFEIHATDLDKAQKFYQDVFGWDVKDMGPQMGNYRLVTTGTEGPGIDGGMIARRGGAPEDGAAVNAYVCVMGVANIHETLEKIEKAGGTIATDIMDVPGVGLLAYRKDPDGNIFGVLQPAEMGGAAG